MINLTHPNIILLLILTEEWKRSHSIENMANFVPLIVQSSTGIEPTEPNFLVGLA